LVGRARVNPELVVRLSPVPGRTWVVVVPLCAISTVDQFIGGTGLMIVTLEVTVIRVCGHSMTVI
jgi:hypothetical protein